MALIAQSVEALTIDYSEVAAISGSYPGEHVFSSFFSLHFPFSFLVIIRLFFSYFFNFLVNPGMMNLEYRSLSRTVGYA